MIGRLTRVVGAGADRGRRAAERDWLRMRLAQAERTAREALVRAADAEAELALVDAALEAVLDRLGRGEFPAGSGLSQSLRCEVVAGRRVAGSRWATTDVPAVISAASTAGRG